MYDTGNIPKGEAAIKEAAKAFTALDFATCEKRIEEGERYYPGYDQIVVLRRQLTDAREKRKKEDAEAILQSVVLPKFFKAEKTSTDTVKLTWDAATFSPPRKVEISYIVVRKEDSVPASENDGQTIVQTQGLHFEDTTTKEGQVYGYSVFVSILGFTKPKGTFGNKIIRTVPVSRPQALGEDGRIRLIWQAPNKTEQIIIVRKKGSIPKDIKDGDPLPTGSALNGYVDNNLLNNLTYGYWLVPVFKGINGETLLGSPKTVMGTPRELPPAPGKVEWQVGEQGLDIQWEVIPKSDLRFYLSKLPLGNQGDSRDLNDPVFSSAIEITACDYSKGQGRYSQLLTEAFYLTPVSRNKYVALLGASVRVVPVPNVKNFKSNRIAGTIFLTWDWPDKVNEVKLVYRTNGKPTTLGDDESTRIIVTREMYRKNEAYIIRNSGSDSYYFLVAAVSSVEEEQFSTPQKYENIGSGENTILRYEFIKQGGGFFTGTTHYFLRISVVKGDWGIPELDLVKCKGKQPLRKSDGPVVKQIGLNNAPTIDVDISTIVEKGTYYKLFLRDSGDSGKITIDHPSPPEKMKLL